MIILILIVSFVLFFWLLGFIAISVILSNRKILKKITKLVDEFPENYTEEQKKELKRTLINLKFKIIADKNSTEKATDLINSI